MLIQARASNLPLFQADIKKTVDGVDPAGAKRIGYTTFLPIFNTYKKATTAMTFEDYVEGMKVNTKLNTEYPS